jgi:hypothetical protein
MASLIGCDFSSRPTARKPIVIAWGRSRGDVVVLERIEHVVSLDGFSQWLNQPNAWTGGFDMPFGLPRELVEKLGWPTTWEACLRHYATLSRLEIRTAFAAFCNSRAPGSKFAHRACDRPAGSSPSMKWVNPPVAYMLHAGVPRLLDAGVVMPGIHMPMATARGVAGQTACRVALEAYPGMLARELIGTVSYKSDDRVKQTNERLIARKDILTGLEAGRTRLGLRVKLTHAQRDTLANDAKGDSIDALLCLVQAAWGQRQYENGDPLFGLPGNMDGLEGWIVTA